jgi:hypothetical protein
MHTTKYAIPAEKVDSVLPLHRMRPELTNINSTPARLQSTPASKCGQVSRTKPLEHRPAADTIITAGRTDRQQAIAALIAQTVITNGIDYGGGDVVSVYSDTIGYRIIDAVRGAGLAVTRRR